MASKHNIGAILLALLLALTLEVACYGSQELMPALRTAVPSGTAAAVQIRNGRTPVALLTANFSSGSNSRACWDIPLSVNLSACGGIRLRMRAVNASLTQQLTVHLQVGGRWFSTVCTPVTNGLWEEVILPKSSFLPEGDGGAVSWQRCTRLRFAAWPGGTGGVFQWQLAGVELLTASAQVALLRTGVTGQGNHRRAAWTYARHLSDALVSGGVIPAVIDEPDVTFANLKGFQCVLLPAAEHCDRGTVGALSRYVRNGGRIFGFYALPPALSAAMGLPAGRYRRSADLGVTLAGIGTPFGTRFRQNSAAFMEVTPPAGNTDLKIRAWWHDATGRRLKYPAILQSPFGLWMTHVYLKQDLERSVPLLLILMEDYLPGLRDGAIRELAKRVRFACANAGRQNRNTTRALADLQHFTANKDYPGVWRTARRCQEALADSATPQLETAGPGRRGEMRGAWLRSHAGFPGLGWDKTMARIKAANINTLFPLVMTPQGPVSETNVWSCLRAAQLNNIRIHGWYQVLSAADAPAAFRRQLASEGRLQQRSNGSKLPWLCPTQIKNRQYVVQQARTLVTKYPLSGLHLDMLRYESSQCCYCSSCYLAFRKFIGLPADAEVPQWPVCTLDEDKLREPWLRFRRHQITTLLREIATTVRKIRPQIAISAAVFPDLASARIGVAQEWDQWVKGGYVNFISTMTYRPAAHLFQGDIIRQKEQLGLKYAAALRPGIGVTTNELSPQEVNRQIQVVRNAGLDGYILFEARP